MVVYCDEAAWRYNLALCAVLLAAACLPKDLQGSWTEMVFLSLAVRGMQLVMYVTLMDVVRRKQERSMFMIDLVGLDCVARGMEAGS